jgi:murein DD-endopeptidase MepM/ murein hydrolase activator NlpD
MVRESSRGALFFVFLLCVSVAYLYLAAIKPVVHAQSSTPEPPDKGPRSHSVVEGDNLTIIAEQYGVTVEQVQLVNHLRDNDILSIGQQLIIPGGDIYPAAIVYTAKPGDSLRSIATKFNVTAGDLLLSNRTINSEYVPAVGQPVVLMIDEGGEEPTQVTGIPHIVQGGETILELGVRYNIPVSHLMYINELNYPVHLFPGQKLRIPDEEPFFNLPGEWTEILIKPSIIEQGDTIVVYVENLLDGEPFGQFAGQDLHFVPYENGHVALAGIDAFTEAGRYAIELGGSGDRPWSPFGQEIAISDSNFPNQAITVPEELSDLLDPSIRSEEDAFLNTLYSSFSEEKKWDGLFQVPVTDTLVTAPYGGGRSYNEGPITIFHSGTDFNGDIGTPILAPANGTVIFNDYLELRGNTVIIDHGWGVMTGYYHLTDSYVEEGQEVETGQQIGTGGSTGLSTGPHLHWEFRIMGVPVDGMNWTLNPFP